jgi:heavy metal efflux system protein
MISALIRFALVQRLMMLLVAGALTAGGLWAYRTLPIDAFPDIYTPQVQITVKAPGMTPEEIEQRISFPIEVEMQGLPRQTALRSLNKYALGIVTVWFEDGTDIYWARNQVAERLNQVRAGLPADVEPSLAPITTPLGEIYMYRIEGGTLDNTERRTLQDWVIRPRLRAVDGVADVNSLGGEVRAFEVRVMPDRLVRHGLGLDDLERALADGNRNAGGDRIDRADQTLLVRSVGALRGADDIGKVVVATRAGTPVLVRDVAKVRLGSLTRYGAVTADARGEVVTGLVLLRKGANGRTTVEGVKRELAALAPALPEGVRIVPFYDRAELIESAVRTVETVLGEAVLLVLVVLVVLLGNLRAALTVALILPLSVLFTFLLMRLFGVSANLMSLGGLAIAIGILVDAAVVVVENVHTRLARAPAGVSRLHLVYRAATEVGTPVLSGVLIIVIVFLPLFALSGLEGKMFAPLALTICFALVGSLLLSLTVIPVLASLIMRAGGRHTEDRVLAAIKRVYLPAMRWALAHRAAAAGGALAALAIAAALFPFIGREFMPVMDEGTTVVIIEKKPDITLDASLAADALYHRAMMDLPEVTGVVARTGADELRLDPMGLYQTDNFIQTRPRAEWTRSLGAFQEALRAQLEPFDDIEIAFTQPIDMRVSEMLSGVRAALAVKLYGDDLEVLEAVSQRIERLASKVRGAVDIVRPPLLGQQYLQIEIDAERIARYGIRVEDVNRLVETAVGGRVVTEVVEPARRTGVLLRYPEAARASPQALARLLVETPGGAKVPLALLADIREVDGPVQITREAGERLAVVQVNVEGRDVVGFVADVRAAIERELDLPRGYRIEYGGQFENQQRAAARLGLVVPISIALIFVLLFTTFRSLSQAGLILLNIPFALIGGVIGLYASGLYLSVPASVGFITLFGVAVLNGVVMVVHFNQLRDAGRSVLQAVQEGAERRLRPVLMTALIASLGLVPMLLASGPGSELQRPLAVVVIGGLFTSTALTLLLLPTLYAWLVYFRSMTDEHESTRHGAGRTGILCALAAAVLFGASTPFAKLLLDAFPPVALAGLLYAASGVGLLGWFGLRRLLRHHTRREAPLARQDLPWLAGAIAAGGVAAPVLLLWGLAATPAASAALLLNLEGVFTALLAWFVFRENVDRRIALGMGLIVLAGVLLSWGGEAGAHGLSLGAAAIVAACLGWAIDNNLTRKVSAADPVQIAGIKGLVAGAVNLGIAFALGWTPPPVSALLGGAVVGLFGYGVSLALFVRALRDIGTARTGAYFSTAPFIGAGLALLLLHETPAPLFWVAVGLMAAGVWLHLTEHHAHIHEHEALTHRHAHVHDEHHRHEHEFPWDGREPHTHDHEHRPLIHSHPHYPDIHHRHRH